MEMIITMFNFIYYGTCKRNQLDGIIPSLPFAPPSMAPLTADQAPNYRIDEVSNFNVTDHEIIWNLVPDKAAPERYHPPDVLSGSLL